MESSNIRKIALVMAAISWALLFAVGLTDQHYSHQGRVDQQIPIFVRGVLLNLFIFSLYAYTSIRTQREQRHGDLHDLIWKVFLTALVCTLFSGLLSILSIVVDTGDSLNNSLLNTFFFYVEFGLMVMFLMTAFSKWKQMILYERSKFALFTWFGFEYLLFTTTIIHFFSITPLTLYFNIVTGFFFLWVLVLSVNLKWIPHLVFNQKLISIFQLVIVLFCLAYFLASITSYYDNELMVVDDISKNLFFAALYIFVVVYTISSLLVIIFNLPTSSVFEKKVKELAVFQRLSESIMEGASEQQMYEILLDSALATVNADAAWLEIQNTEQILRRNLEKEEVQEINQFIIHQGFRERSLKKITKRNIFQRSSEVEFRTIMAVPLVSGEQQLGTLVLLKKMKGAFDNTMIRIVSTFVAQASIAVHNFKLLSQAVENERYKNELEIAKSVQARLLPKVVESNNAFQIYAMSKSAKEVGGDYFDLYQRSENEHIVIIADVAGKGISAAFNMAQLKGIFQALIRLELQPDQFLIEANAALGKCLEKSVFITASIYLINAEKKTVTYARAGHCPTLYYNSVKQKLNFMESQGLGLGIIRNESFKKHVTLNEMPYHAEDMMMLYTDGIIEATNSEKHELFGYDRLKEHVSKHIGDDLEKIADSLLEEIVDFTKNPTIDDDSTILLIKF